MVPIFPIVTRRRYPCACNPQRRRIALLLAVLSALTSAGLGIYQHYAKAPSHPTTPASSSSLR